MQGHRMDSVAGVLAAFGGVGHDVVRPPALVGWRAPVVFASPHSGSVYPDGFRRASDLPHHVLRRNADARVDDLFGCAPDLGAPLLSARFPRCFVDANRAGDDVPPEWAKGNFAESEWTDDVWPAAKHVARRVPDSAYRAELGLGVVPLLISEHQAIHRYPPSRAEARARIAALHTPYHAALSGLLAESRARFGRAVLIDCHSMPGFAAVKRGKRSIQPIRRADVVLGDGHGQTAQRDTVTALEAAFVRRGYSVVRNRPYAGGFSTLAYGRPDAGVEAVQIELNRDLYFNPATGRVKRGYGKLCVDLRGVCAEVMEALAPGLEMAAE